MKTPYSYITILFMLLSIVPAVAQEDNLPVEDVTRTYYREINGVFYKLRGTEAIVFERFNDYKPYFDNVVIPQTVTYQGVEYTVVSIGEHAFSGSYGLTSITLPPTIRSIGGGAFYNCIGLREFRCPENVTRIEDTAFTNCTGLSSVTIGPNVTNISETAFNSCPCLTSIKVDPSNPVFDSRNDCNAIIRTADNALMVGCERTVIPPTVTSILPYAFQNRLYLHHIVIPDGVTSIDGAFYSSSLYTVIIPASVTTITGFAFENSNRLTAVTILGSNVTLNGYVFSNCYSLLSFTILAPEPPVISRETFSNCSEKLTVHVLPGCEAAYAAAPFWSRFTIVGDADKMITDN